MDEQRETDNNRLLLTSCVCIAITVILSKMSIGSLLFNLPLLLLAPRIKKTGYAVLTFVVSTVLIIAVSLFDYRDFSEIQYFGSFFVALFFQIASTMGAVIWTALRDYSKSVLRKLVICSFPIAVLGITFSVLMMQPFAAQFVSGLKQAVSIVFEAFSFNMDKNEFADVFVTVLHLTIVPIGLIYSGVPIILSELVLNKRNESWQQDFACMKMPNLYVWVFMASWLAVILSGMMEFPFWFNIIVWNTAFGLSLHYFMSGISIVTFLIRKKAESVSANRIFITVLILCIFPGLNVVAVGGLAVLGALETWIKIR